MSVLVVCPTRHRPAMVKKMADSFLATTTNATLVVAIDEDQRDLYLKYQNAGGRLPETERIEISVAPRRPLVQIMNEAMAERMASHDLFGMMADDAVFTVSGWDEWALAEVKRWDRPVGVISPQHNYGGHVDMPYVTREWMQRLGWFANPEFKYWCWPTFTGMLGEATRITRATKEQFGLLHDDQGPSNWDTFPAEAKVFYEQCLWKFYPLVEKLES